MSQLITTRRIHPDLPIFLLESPDTSVLYAPGTVAAVPASECEMVERAFRSKSPDSPGWLNGLVDGFLDAGRRAKQSWDELATAKFRPTCLTVYLSNSCNLGCTYCYAANNDGSRIRPADADGLVVLGSTPPLPRLNEEKLLPPARLVAENCRQQGKPFQLVVHGGGEPTLHWELLRNILATTRTVAGQAGVHWSSYIATHGVLDGKKARWLAEHFDHIGISCDGPPDIHDAQRSTASGQPTFAHVADTIRSICESQARITIRATVTRRSLKRQAEIITYFHSEFGVRHFQFEPLYLASKSSEAALTPDDAIDFANHFLAAQRVADALNCVLNVSGVRLDEIHGPYCNVLRDVLQLTPDHSASACFLITDAQAPGGAEMVIGWIDSESGRFQLDMARIRQMRLKATKIPTRCEQCVNIYHCARDCPDVCPISDTSGMDAQQPGFRCLVQKELGQRWIIESARIHVGEENPRPNGETIIQLQRISQAIRELPPGVDADHIVRQWQLASRFDRFDSRSMPEPPWSRSGFQHNGDLAWERLSRQLALEPMDAAMSCYVHMPYCDRKCGFCDCYAQMLAPGDEHKQLKYVQALIDEVHAWGQFTGVTGRPITTVHFGGGTPSFVPPRFFEQVLRALRTTIRVHPLTEWALETTSSQLTPEYLVQLREWGFSRLHVGVQTFDDNTRRLIGRRDSARVVLRKLALALEAGFVVSIDLIYGLPGQTIKEFVHDVEATADLGLDGCSLYHLNGTHRNGTFISRHDGTMAQAFERYLFFQVGEAILGSRGFAKNHFAHFARPRDKNLYYTHVVRGEDLLALGASADGSFENYCYRHPPIGKYLANTTARRVALEGGLSEVFVSSATRHSMAALLAGQVRDDVFTHIGANALIDRWLNFGMLEREQEGSDYRLTANGSWYLSQLLAELNQFAEHL